MSNFQVLICVLGILTIGACLLLLWRQQRRDYPRTSALDLSDGTAGPDPVLWNGTWNPAEIPPSRHQHMMLENFGGHSEGHHIFATDNSFMNENFDDSDFDDGVNSDGGND